MPIYEYACTHCGESVEQLQRMSDDPLTTCPACGESTLRRKVSAARFRLSGSGWYETDFKSEGKRNLSGDNNKTGSENGSAKPATDGGSKETKKTAGGENKSTSTGSKSKTESGSAGKAAAGSAG